MTISLAKLEAKRGELRRELAAAHKKQVSIIEQLDAKEAVATDLQAKIQASIDAKEDPSEDDTKALAAARKEFKDIRNKALAAKQEVHRLESELAEADQDYQLRADANRTTEFLASSTGENNGSQMPGNDGASVGRGPGSNGESAAGASAERPRVHVKDLTTEQIDHDLGVYFQAQIIAEVDRVDPVMVARDYLGNDRVADAVQQANDFSRGGAWVQGVYSDRFIELLRPWSIVRQAGIDTVPLDDGTLTMPEETAGPSGAYLGEGETADTEEVRTGQVKLIAKELVVQVVSSEKLLRSRSAKAAERIRTSVLRGAGQTEDLYFLRGSASGAGPTGLRYQAHADNILTANGTVNVDNVINDMSRLELALANANVVEMNAFWIMAPRTKSYLTDLRDEAGWVFPTMQITDRNGVPMLRGKPVYSTTQIPITQGGGSDESEIMLVEGSHVVIGDAPDIGFQSSNVAAYNNGGTVKAAFSNRQVVTRLVMENDLKALQRKAIAVMTEVDWGA